MATTNHPDMKDDLHHHAMLAAAAVGLLLFSGCNKYPDGPLISLLSKRERIANTWKIEKCYDEDGNDITATIQQTMKNYRLVIGKDGSYALSYKALGLVDVNESGSWTFTHNAENVRFDRSSPSASTGEWKILRLKETQLWGRSLHDPKTTLHLIPD